MALSLKLRRITSALKSKHQSSWEDHNGRLVAALRFFFSVGSSFNQAENHGTSMLLNHQKSGLIYVGLWALMIFDWILEGDGRLIGTSCGRKGQHLSRSTGRTSHCTSSERLPLTLEEGLHQAELEIDTKSWVVNILTFMGFWQCSNGYHWIISNTLLRDGSPSMNFGPGVEESPPCHGFDSMTPNCTNHSPKLTNLELFQISSQHLKQIVDFDDP